jgi:hypothetical protein
MNLFKNPAISNSLPRDFYTTVKGLKQAWDEANAAVPDVNEDLDATLLEAVRRRGGVVVITYARMAYPGDIVPLEGVEGDVEFWDGVCRTGKGGMIGEKWGGWVLG